VRFYISKQKFSRWIWGFKRYPTFWCVNLGKRDLFIYW